MGLIIVILSVLLKSIFNNGIFYIVNKNIAIDYMLILFRILYDEQLLSAFLNITSFFENLVHSRKTQKNPNRMGDNIIRYVLI